MVKDLSRRAFVGGSAALAASVAGMGLAGCSGGSSQASSASGSASSAATDAAASSAAESVDKVVFVWEPNESTSTYDGMRQAVADCIAKGAGVPCEVMTTTDYNVTIESLSSGKAQMASLGASEYVEVHAKNPDVGIAFVLSNDQGELDQASYWCQICCRAEELDKYKDGDDFVLGDLEGTNFSYVNLNSTSGFVMPATYIKNENDLDNTDILSESGKYFDQALFPGSHPGSLFNLLSGDSDLSVFADYLVAPFVELVSGEPATPGAIYRVKEGVDAPLDAVVGQEFAIVVSLPVPAVPICINTAALPEQTVNDIIEYMCGDEVAANEKIFPKPDDTDTVSNWTKTTDKVRFVPADDSYYDEFRTMIDFED